MDMEELLKKPESKTLEFKRDLSSLQPILKTIVAFANTAGGTLIVGLTSEGNLVGIEDIFREEEKLANAISENIRPSLLPEIEIMTSQGKNLLVVKVAHWKGPFYIKQLGLPNGVFIRLGSTSRPAGPDLLAELQRSVLHLSFDENPIVDLTPESLDLEKAKTIFQKKGKHLDEKKLRSLGILVPHAKRLVPSIGGLILFGHPDERRQFVPHARANCVRFRGDGKSEILDRSEIEGTILDAIESVPQFIARNTRLAAEIIGMHRQDIPEYPPIAVREVLINAFAHSDYSIQGSSIQIAIYNNHLEVQNPGMLPFGFTLDDFKSGVSRVRNRVIARVFNELGFMEEWGSGYKKITEACHEQGYLEPEWIEFGSSLRVTFDPHKKTVLKDYSEPVLLAEEQLTYKQESVLDIFNTGDRIAFKEIKNQMSINISERSLHYELARLRELGYLTPIGKGRAVVWKRVR